MRRPNSAGSTPPRQYFVPNTSRWSIETSGGRLPAHGQAAEKAVSGTPAHFGGILTDFKAVPATFRSAPKAFKAGLMDEAADFYTAEVDLKHDETASSRADTERSCFARGDSQGSTTMIEDPKGKKAAQQIVHYTSPCFTIL